VNESFVRSFCTWPFKNGLLRALPPEDLEPLAPLLEPFELRAGRVLSHAKIPITHFYFIEKGLVSVEAEVERQRWVEVWQVGREGGLGLPAIVGRSRTCYRRFVLIGGTAYRISIGPLKLAIQHSSLRGVLLRYLYDVLLQTSCLSACRARHSLPQRLARWLLLASDRYEESNLPITQAAIARALGIRRASVSDSLGEFEQCSVLRRERGAIALADRRALKDLSCSCYSTIHKDLERGLKSVMLTGEKDGRRSVGQIGSLNL
jgi:CRP-like cAMP-binding protein